MSCTSVTADKPPKPDKAIACKTAGDDVENLQKKARKKIVDGVLRSRNDAVTRTELSHTVKRKSEQVSNLTAEDSGCPLLKKPSPEHIVSTRSLSVVHSHCIIFSDSHCWLSIRSQERYVL